MYDGVIKSRNCGYAWFGLFYGVFRKKEIQEFLVRAIISYIICGKDSLLGSYLGQELKILGIFLFLICPWIEFFYCKKGMERLD